MEFGQCFRLILIGLCAWNFACWPRVVLSSWSQSDLTALPASCQSKASNWSFASVPLSALPPSFKFMLSSSSCDEENVECTSKCLAADSVSVQAADCDGRALSQSWFQIDRSLVNVFEEKCLTASSTDSLPTLDICDVSNLYQKWSCSRHSPTSAFALQSNGSSKYIASQGNANVVLTSATTALWRVLNPTSATSQHNGAVCVEMHRFCGLPLPGLHSYIVSSRLDFSILPYLPTAKLQQHLQYDIKSCYVSGDVVLVSCAKGHVRIGSGSETHKIMTCIGGGMWTNPKPLQCVRRSCGRPRRPPNTRITGASDYSYGDLVRFKCTRPYVGRSTAQVCGPVGEWVGDLPTCRHSCRFNLTGLSGQIRSPNYPQPYPSNSLCEWGITVAPGLRIALWFRDFYLEPGSLLLGECRHDVLYVQDLPVDATKGVERLCGGHHPEMWYSSGNRALVGFQSDQGGRGKGFKIDYTTWNASVSEFPTKPQRSGSFPDEEDLSNVYTSSDQANYYFQVLYVSVVCLAVLSVLLIIGRHFYQNIKARMHVQPQEEDFIDEQERKRKLAQRRMTTVFDPMTVTPSVMINEALLDGMSTGSTSSSRSTIDEFKPPEIYEPQELWTAQKVPDSLEDVSVPKPALQSAMVGSEKPGAASAKSKRQQGAGIRFATK